MNDFYDLTLPREIRFRTGAAKELPALLPCNAKNILFIAGNHALKSGDAAEITAILEQAGKKVTLISGVPPEPAPAEVDRLIKAGRDAQADAVVALGGGSVIDAAKAAAALIPAVTSRTSTASFKTVAVNVLEFSSAVKASTIGKFTPLVKSIDEIPVLPE